MSDTLSITAPAPIVARQLANAALYTNKDHHPVFCFIRVTIADGIATLEATDSRGLVRCTLVTDSPDGTFFIPRETALSAVKHAKAQRHGDVTLAADSDTRTVAITGAGVSLSATWPDALSWPDSDRCVNDNDPRAIDAVSLAPATFARLAKLTASEGHGATLAFGGERKPVHFTVGTDVSGLEMPAR